MNANKEAASKAFEGLYKDLQRFLTFKDLQISSMTF